MKTEIQKNKIQFTKWHEDENYDQIKNKFPKFCAHIKKHCVVEASEILDELCKEKELVRILVSELEAYAYGNAYCKVSGKPWNHRIEGTIEILKEIDVLDR